MERAFIIGCGYTGAVLAGQLQAAGIPTAGTSASGRPVAGATIEPLDLLAPPPALDFSAAAGAVVYYMVATLASEYDATARPHLAPLRAALNALRPHPIAGLIYLSSTSVYGDRGAAWVDEDTPVTPGSPWAQMRVDVEQAMWAYGRTRQIPVCVARLPEIYGPGRGPATRLRAGHPLRFPERYSNRIHVADLADVLLELGQRLAPRLLLVADDQPALSAEVYACAAVLLGLPTPVAEPSTERDPSLLALQRDSKRCSNARLRAWLGRPLRYPTYRAGLPTTI